MRISFSCNLTGTISAFKAVHMVPVKILRPFFTNEKLRLGMEVASPYFLCTNCSCITRH